MIHGDTRYAGCSRFASTRSAPSAPTTTSDELPPAMTRMNAISGPFGDQPGGLVALVASTLGAPPRNGARSSSPAGAPSRTLVQLRNSPVGSNAGAPMLTPASGTTVRALPV